MRGWLRSFIDKARFLLQDVGQLGKKTLTPQGHRITFENERVA